MPITAETTVTAAELALVLDLSPRHVARMAAAGEIPTAGKARFRLAEAVRAYFARKLAGDPQAAARLAAAKATKEEHLAGLRELELRQKSGELAEVRLFDNTLLALMGTLRQRLINIPPAAAPLCVGEPSVAVVEAVIRDQLFAAMQEIADDGEKRLRKLA